MREHCYAWRYQRVVTAAAINVVDNCILRTSHLTVPMNVIRNVHGLRWQRVLCRTALRC